MRDDDKNRRLMLAGLLFLIYVAPFDEGAGRDLLPLTLIALGAICLAVAVLRRSLATGHLRPFRSPALLPLVLLLAVGGASVFWSIDRFVSLTGVVRLFACVVAFMLVLTELRDVRHARTLCAAMVLLGCLLGPLGIWQALTGTGLFPTGTGARGHSVFVTPNTFAGFLIITIPIAVSLALTARSARLRLAYWFGTALLLVSLAGSQSRGAWAAGAVGLGFLVWQLVRLKVLAVQRRTVLVTLILAAGALACFAALGTRKDILGGETFADRAAYWTTAARMARAGWPLGIGLDTYHIDYMAHQPVSSAGSREWFAHNDYLQVLVELGPVGFAALAWFLWRMARMARRTLRAGTEPATAALVAGCRAGAGAALLHSMLDYNLYVPATALPIFVCLGIVAAAYSRTFASSAAPVCPVTPNLRPVFSTLVLAAGVAAALLSVRPLVAQRLLEKSLWNAPSAVALCPWSASYWAYQAEAQLPHDPRAARKSLREAIRLSPRSAELHARLGLLLCEKGKLDADSAETVDGLEQLGRACELQRWSARLRWWYGHHLLEAGRVDDARRQFEVCLEQCRPNEKLRQQLERVLAGLGHVHEGKHDDHATQGTQGVHAH